MKTEYKLPDPQIKAFYKKNNASSIVNAGKVASVETFRGQKCIITGSVSSGAEGILEVSGYIVVDIDQYKGKLKPLKYADHFRQVRAGKRERSYIGMKLQYGAGTIVVTGPKLKFLPTEKGKQNELF